MRIRFILMIGYGVVFWVCYMGCFGVYKWLVKTAESWNIWRELLFLVFFSSISLVPNYAYYRTDLVNGTYSFSIFTFGVYLPTLAVLLPVLVLSRYLAGLQYERSQLPTVEKEDPLVTLTGDNKLDVLRLAWPELVAVSAADNYVEIFYKQQNGMEKRLLRTTLKRVREEVPNLVQIHRSHLINPSHFRAWHDLKTIQVDELQMPVSKKFKPTLTRVLDFAPR